MSPAPKPTPDASGRRRRGTATQNFGSSKREGHDASAFYERFVAPELSDDTTVNRPSELDVIYQHDARDMSKVESNSVALVVTSPPYFAGKQYEESLGENGVPATYFEYLGLLRDVFDECKRVLEPGGRIAVNVANLGRRPYRSLAGDVTTILQDLGLLLRGEVVWWKGKAAGGSCAWGSFQRPGNPVLRDVTERIVIASKGRFERALSATQRVKAGLPATGTITRDEFLEATTDLWELPPESATRVRHPAPFPVELPARLIELYTYEGDVVLDPFMGSGSSAVAAARAGRHYLGFDTDASYIDLANERIASEVGPPCPDEERVSVPFRGSVGDTKGDLYAAAIRKGLLAKDLAYTLLDEAGFTDITVDPKIPRSSVDLAFFAHDANGARWAVDVVGGFTMGPMGLKRGEDLWRTIGEAAVLRQFLDDDVRLLVLTTSKPTAKSPGANALASVCGSGRLIYDVVELRGDTDGHDRLRAYASGQGVSSGSDPKSSTQRAARTNRRRSR